MAKLTLTEQLLLIGLYVFTCRHVDVNGQGRVFLSLNGRNISNGSYVDGNDIGDRPGSSALLCHTDLHECCTASQTIDEADLGNWILPNGEHVKYMSSESNTASFHRDRDRSVVRLWRHGTPAESGLFCCSVPDSSNILITVCANIVNITITAQPLGYQQVILGDTVVLTVVAHISLEDQNMLMYQWQRNNHTIQDGSKFHGTQTAQLMVNDVQRGDQGTYNCVLNDIIVSDEAVLTLGVYLLFDERVLSNNSYINVDEQIDISICCFTNNTGCCRNNQVGGNWYFPSGAPVLSTSSSEPSTFTRNRRSQSLRLSAYGLNPKERGKFVCKIPNTNGIEESIYIRLLSKPAIVRQPPALTVMNPSNNVTLAIESFGGDVTYQWFKDGIMIMDSEKYLGSRTSELTISAAHRRDGGTFSCSLTNDLGNVVSQDSLLLIVNEPEIGMQYSLTCSAAGSGQLHPSLTYQWYKDGRELINETSSVLFFESLTFCDVGNYSCSPSLSDVTLLGRQQFELKFSSLQFQLWIGGVKFCPEWILTHKPEEVAHSLVDILNDQCQCGLTTMHITEEKLTCSFERESKVTFSARLSHTSTTDIINHLHKRLLNDSTVTVTLNKGTENETDTELIIEQLISPSCFDHGDLEAALPPATSMMLSASEIALCIAIGLLFCAILAIIILSIAVYQLKQKLYDTRLHPRSKHTRGNDITTSVNISYQEILHQGSTSSQLNAVDGENLAQVYEEIANAEHYNVVSYPDNL